MNPSRVSTLLLAPIVTAWAAFAANPTPGPLTIRERDGQTEVLLPAQPVTPVVGNEWRLTLERSSDLHQWDAGVEVDTTDNPGTPLRFPVDGSPIGFFRLRADRIEVPIPDEGAALFGYNRVFTRELQRAGYLSVEAFEAHAAASEAFLTRLDFDPTTARYWTELNTDPAVFNATLPADSLDRRLHDFRLTPQELDLLRANGFVVSERLGSHSFADVYYKIYADDFPVFISADSILHAWHWSYQAALGELEELQLTLAYTTLLDQLHAGIPAIAAEVQEGLLRNSVLDADYFIAVARSLLAGSPVASALGQDSRVAATLDAIGQARHVEDFPLWGTPRAVDFSQFTVRGHYTRTAALGRYHQAYQWTALADLRVAGMRSSVRELGTAVVLDELHTRSTNPTPWNTIDTLLRIFVGRVDSMTFLELSALRTAAGLTFAAANRPGELERFQIALQDGDYGVANYATAAYPTPFGPGQTQLPRLFSLTGKRFIPDGWATAQVTFDRIRWHEELPDNRTVFGKVVRRLPTALDVAYGVLGNLQVAPEIAEGIRSTGLPYQHNLTAVKATLDGQDPSAWQSSIYTQWLYALRMLSATTTDSQYPQAMRTRAWSHKNLNTQLASWTQLRHDTALYVAQPYSSQIVCEYPAGFVEPRLEFWEAMRRMATDTAAAIERFPMSGTLVFPSGVPGGSDITVELHRRHEAQVQHYRNFANIMARLRDLAAKQLAGVPHDAADILFIRSTMNNGELPYYGKTYTGWYPMLFYKDYGQELPFSTDINASDRRDLLVTDVHSAPPDPLYRGGVLHQAVGDVDLLVIAVDCAGERMIYLGPTLSHYEFTEPGMNRLNNEAWRARVDSTTRPARPGWTRDYLVPR